MGKLKTVGYELRDVAVMQAPVSFCNHRGDVNPFIEVCKREVYPIFVAPMASVTDQNNYKTWIENKLTPVVPRSVQKSENNPNGITFEERMELAKETFVSISLKEAQNNLIDYLASNAGWDKYYICIDIAHGTLSELYDICKKIKSMYGDTVEIMTGNVANPSAYSFYADAGISWCRVGIGGGCFTPDMCVVTKDGLKKICDIKIGDEVLTHTGEFHKVTHVHERQKNEKLVRINNIECTSNHLFYVVNKNDAGKITEDNIQEYAYWVQANELDKENHYLVKKGSETKLRIIENIEYFDYNGKVYDLTVDVDETYNINGVIVHNSRCTTSCATGIHMGLATLLDQMNEARKAYAHSHNGNAPTKIIADGGIDWYDCIPKSLSLGADAVMIGKLFAECEEACGEIFYAKDIISAEREYSCYKSLEPKGGMKKYRNYAGMSHRSSQKITGGDGSKVSEGIVKPVEVKYPVSHWIENMNAYLRSSMTYTNSMTIKEMQENAQVIILGGSGDAGYRK